MKRIICIVLITALLGSALCGCKGNEKDKTENDTTAIAMKVPNPNLPLISDMAGSEVFEEVTSDMENAGLSNVNAFRAWVQDFIETAGEKGKLSEDWIKPEDEKADLAACSDAWESKYDYSDADCRITAMLLLDGILTCEKTEGEYKGTYLMFDIDALDNAVKYLLVEKNRDMFTTLFGEKEIKEGEKGEEVFPRIWEEYGFRLYSDRVSLITVVCTDVESKSVFVGHTGVLIDMNGEYLFVEKLAFEQPYRATRIASIDELVEIFNSRSEYFDNEQKTGTWFYRNGERLN
jgi:hypothetical protein